MPAVQGTNLDIIKATIELVINKIRKIMRITPKTQALNSNPQ